MKILDFLCSNAVNADLKATNKKELIEEMVSMMVEAGAFEKKNKVKIIDVLIAREALGSTAIGQGIAIPHGKTDCVDKLVAGLGISKKGIDFDALDGEPAYIFFLLAAPVDSAGPHLKALARVSRLLKDKYFRESLRVSKDKKDILELVSREDAQIS
ncbi:MAG: PTS sugar transporter subunit IIA [Candidatus Omnitrophica bacterium]|nr:PTS sugar transporter subunit IIA [Candidatus Omnitrophota bacterium]